MATLAPPTLNDLLERDRQDAWARFDEMSSVYARELRRLSREAASRLHRHQWTRPLTAAGDPADWVLPDPDELINLAKAAGELDGKTRKLREQIAETSIGGTLAAYGLSFNLRNPVIQNVISQMGQHITRIVEDQRREIMESLQRSWEDGLSIRDASRAMIRESIVSSRTRGDMIARTELTGATNGGSLAAVRLINDASPLETRLVKIWIATNDDRTRDSHAQASDDYGPGSGIPVTEPFIIGGAAMDHPGDPAGPPEEVINCRCTIGYEQGTGGEATAPAVAEEPLPPPIESVAPQRDDLFMGRPPSVGEDGPLPPQAKPFDRPGAEAMRQEIRRWPETQPWTRPKQDFIDGKVPGFRYAPPDEGYKFAARMGDPKTGEDVIVVTDGAFERGVSAAEAKADSGLLYHEAGHMINTGETTPEMEKALEPFKKPTGKGYNNPWTNRYGDTPSYSDNRNEIISDAYSWYMHGGLEREMLYVPGIDGPAGGAFTADELAARQKWVDLARYIERAAGDAGLPDKPAWRVELAANGNVERIPITTAGSTAPLETTAANRAAAMAKQLITSASREEPQVTHDLSTIVRSEGGEMGGLQFRLKTEKSLAGKLERKAREKGITPEEYSKSVADVLRYTGVFKPEDYARGVEQTLERLRKAGYEIKDSDIENYWATGDDYNGINATALTPNGYRFELQFHTQESLDLKNGELHKLYEQFRDESNPHERYRLWTRMVDLSNGISQPDEAVLRIGTRTLHKPPALPETPEELAKSLIESAQRRDEQVTGDLTRAIDANLGRMEGLEFRIKGQDSLVRKLTAKGPLDPVAYSTKVADVLRYTGVFEPEDYDLGVQGAIKALREAGYKIEDSDIENYWQPGDDYNGININVQTADGYRFELQFHTPESFALKNGELHRLYEEYRVSTDPFIRRQLWDQMVNLSDNLQTRMDLNVIMNVRKIGTLASHESPVAAGLDEIDAVTHFDKYLRGDAAEALDRYTGIAYDDMNAFLRTGDLKIDRHTGTYEYLGDHTPEKVAAEPALAAAKATRLRQVEAWINNLKDTFLPSEKPFLAYRGFRKAVLTDKYGASEDLQNLVGKTITDKGFVSISADRQVAEGFGTGDKVVMELVVPKNMPSLNVSRSGSGNTFESEIILPPGSKFVIQSVRDEALPYSGKVHIIRAIVEPPDG